MAAPIQVEPARAADIADIAAVLREGSVWMAAKGCPPWTEAALSTAYIAGAVARGEFLVARSAGQVAGVCTLSNVDPLFWPDDPPGEAAYLHKLAVRRAFAGRAVTPRLVGACEDQARKWSCGFLRLDCHPMIRGVYEALGFTYVDTRQVHEDGGAPMIVDRLQRGL